jgi:hypothetical protein
MFSELARGFPQAILPPHASGAARPKVSLAKTGRFFRSAESFLGDARHVPADVHRPCRG